MNSVLVNQPAPGSLDRLLNESQEKGTPGSCFEQESARMLRIEMDGGVWLKPGAAVAYRGDISFERLPTLDAHSLTEAGLRELAPLVRATGRGRLYCGHRGWHVRAVRLTGETIVVAWEELLAFEESLSFETMLVSHGVGIAAGGLVAVRLSGFGALAIALHGSPLTLPVSPDNPVITDPHATLAWSGDLEPSLKTDLSWRSVFRHGGQEPVQMVFRGTGYVMVQPFEDPGRLPLHLDPLKRIKSLVTG
jgi:uncharacterized protein (AIM24 family)